MTMPVCEGSSSQMFMIITSEQEGWEGRKEDRKEGERVGKLHQLLKGAIKHSFILD